MRDYVEERNDGYYVAGTRVTLESIVYAFRIGESPEMILRNFSALTLEQVYGAITYYLSHKAEVDAYLIKTEKQWDDFARENPVPPALRAKLDRARQELLANRS
ncbi:MAG TPA: DUF433 domain-containing protein [Bryobacteraceae bacterium]|jgi:uncharacterized protein (DUF433 family)|nr:DUF433 domain-containing protein [Bryobacteraceae bacterium]